MLWTYHEERPEVFRRKGDGNGVTGKEKKREAEEKFLDVVKKDIGEIGAREKDIETVCCGGT